MDQPKNENNKAGVFTLDGTIRHHVDSQAPAFFSNKSKPGIIYKVTNLINGKIYIGKTSNTIIIRKQHHLECAKASRHNMAFHAAIRKYGEENFIWEIIDRCLFAESLIVLEKHYIKLFNSKAPNGYNLTDGGEGIVGFNHSEKTRIKMSESAKNKPPMKESTKEKIRLANIGKKLSDDLKEKLRIASSGKNNHQFGKPLSDEHKNKISDNAKNNPNYGMRGKRVSEETKQKMRHSHRRKNG